MQKDARHSSTYRAARRNEARAQQVRFPWQNSEAKTRQVPPVRLNKRDRSKEAEARRELANGSAIEFTGKVGLARSRISYKQAVRFDPKPKRGWAAKVRRKAFAEFFAEEPDRLERARSRHAWRKKELAAQAASGEQSAQTL